MKLKNIKQTGFSCPSQWDAEDEFSNSVYIRYRHDHFSVSVSDKVIYREHIGTDGYGGCMSTYEMLKIVENVENIDSEGSQLTREKLDALIWKIGDKHSLLGASNFKKTGAYCMMTELADAILEFLEEK